MVTGVPPSIDPLLGVTEVTVTVGSAETVTFADFVSLQPAAVVTVTVTVSATGPGADPAVKLIELVPAPESIVPPVMPQL
jgi:hypothetical protein